MQRSKQVAMGRKKFNMDPKKVRERLQPVPVLGKVGGAQGLGEAPAAAASPAPWRATCSASLAPPPFRLLSGCPRV